MTKADPGFQFMCAVGSFVLQVAVKILLARGVADRPKVRALLLVECRGEQNPILFLVRSVIGFGPPFGLIDIDALAVNGIAALVYARVEAGLSADALFVQVADPDSAAPANFILISVFPFVGDHVSGEEGQVKKVILIPIDFVGGLNGMDRREVAPFALLEGVVGVQVFLLKIVHVGVEQKSVRLIGVFRLHVDLPTY